MRAPTDCKEHPEAPREVLLRHYARIRALSPSMKALIAANILQEAKKNVDN